MIDPTHEHKPNGARPLSEISHLFLSSLRQQAGGPDRARPVRIPPGGMKPADLPTPAGELPEVSPTRKRVTAVFGAHLNGGNLVESTLAYAASLASEGSRVGIAWLDASEFRIQLIECGIAEPSADDPEVNEQLDDRQMTDGLHELNHDVDRWLLVVADPRRPEARELMTRCDDWTMVGTCDHDGIVGGYRTLKGMAESAGRSPLAIAFTDALDDDQATRAFAKLAGVCRQFLDWDVTQEVLASDVEDAHAQTVLWCRGSHDKGQLANAPQWRVMQQFLELTPDAAADAAHYGTADDAGDDAIEQSLRAELSETQTTDGTDAMIKTPSFSTTESSFAANQPMSIPPLARPMAPAAVESSSPPAMAAMSPMSIAPAAAPMTIDATNDVIELPEGASVLSVVLKGGSGLLATPITPPMCPSATLAVGRDRGLVLVAEAGSGLAGMEAIAAAVRWLDDSKQLIVMAMPQLAIDAAVATRVELLIDHADRSAEGLRPLLGNSRITIRTYRKLRWAGRTGLLLDAA